MSQLFVCHTQYNLLLAVGLSSSVDDLVLFIDFNLTDELKKKLEEHFKRCLFLVGNYPKKEMSAKEKLDKITSDIQQLKTFICIYDRIFVVDDMCIQEMYALKCAYKKNKSVEMAWLEDGANAYFSNGVVSGGMGGTSFKRLLRKCFFSLRFGLYGFYDLAVCMGAHKKLESAYVTFPDSIRDELRCKKLIKVTEKQFESGMIFLYSGEKMEFKPGSMIIALDKLDVYGEKLEIVNQLIKKMIENTTGEIYYKYHPRESMELPALKDSIQLERTVALESYLTNSVTKELTVIGIKSTALQTAKKMGYNAISLINHVEEAELVTSFYKSIGIECP